MILSAIIYLGFVSLAVAATNATPIHTIRPPKLVGSLESGRMTLPAVKIANTSDATVQAGKDRNNVHVGSDWYIRALIGTPPKPFYFLPDSGAPNWYTESTLEPLNQQGDAPKYDPSKSSSATRVDGYTYSECYVSGYCDNGDVYTETIVIGNIGLVGMHILVQKNNTSKTYGVRSGNLGLNFDRFGMTTQPTRVPSYFQEVMPFLEAPLWTVDFHASTGEGQFQFGFIDKTKYTGNISYGFVTTSDGQWTTPAQGVQAGYDDAAFTKYQFEIMFDTGSGGGTIPRDAAAQYWRQVPNSVWSQADYNYLFPCGQTLPDFVIALANGVKVGIPDEGLRWKTLGNGMCITMLALGAEKNVIWGQRYLEKFFVIFDWGNGMVGLARKSKQ